MQKQPLRLGIDIGSTTAKVVLADGDSVLFEKYERHFSLVREKMASMLRELSAELALPAEAVATRAWKAIRKWQEKHA